MRAITFQGIEDVAFERVADPELEDPRDALVVMELAGICGSDLHVYHGRETGIDVGTVLGHELVGRIVEVGSAVQSLEPGQPVVCPFTTSCGACAPCRRGLTARCLRGQLLGWREGGLGLHGAQAELVRVPLADTTLVRVPADLSPEQALLAGDVFSTGYYCARQGEVEPGSSVAIVGCGPVGLMAVIAARHLGAEAIFAIDRLPERLQLADRFGALAIDLRHQQPTEIVSRATRGQGVDAVLEAVGNGAATRLALSLVRAGGTVSAVGVHTESAFPFSPAEAYDRNLTYRVGRCSARHYLDIVLPILARCRPDPAAIISHRLPLEEGPQGYQLFADKLDSCTKIVLRP